jgi:RNA polymerase sigma-70 factor (ECF subfamily)
MEAGGQLSPVGVMSEEAFRTFYREHLPSVYGYLLRLCANNTAEAEDLTQDVWFALVEELRRGHDERADVRWLISVARSRFVDHARRQQRGLSKLALLPRPHEDGPEPSGGEVLEGLGSLPPLYRAVLVLRYVDGEPVAGVAAAIGRDIGATNSLLARARAKLRQLGRGGSDD